MITLTMNPSEYIREQRQGMILKLLEERPLTFSRLQKASGLHPQTLKRELNKMYERKLIKQDILDKEKVNKLTKKGQDYLKGMWMILNEIYEMQSAHANYNSNYFSGNNIFWSLLKDIESPHIDYRENIKRISDDYLRIVLASLKEKHVKQNEDNSYSIVNSQEIKGKHIIAFEVDFDLIRKNLEDAIKLIENVGNNQNKMFQSVENAIKEDNRNLYRSILFGEERLNSMHPMDKTELEDNGNGDTQ